MRSMAAPSDFDVISRERERERKGDRKREAEKEGKRERDSERERERADTSSITFSSGGYTVMSDESIFGAPAGGGRRPEGAGATRGAGGQGEKGRRAEVGALDGERVFRTARRCSGTAITIRLGFTSASRKNDWTICHSLGE